MGSERVGLVGENSVLNDFVHRLPVTPGELSFKKNMFKCKNDVIFGIFFIEFKKRTLSSKKPVLKGGIN